MLKPQANGLNSEELMSQRFQSLQTEINFAQHVSQIALLFIVRHVCFAHKYTELKKIEKVNKKISKKTR